MDLGRCVGQVDRPRLSMRLIRYSHEYQASMLALHRSALVGIPLGMSQQQDEADLVAIEQVYLLGGGEFRLGFIGERLVAMGGFKRLSDTSAELKRMRIERELQGRGYGTQLLRELERLNRLEYALNCYCSHEVDRRYRSGGIDLSRRSCSSWETWVPVAAWRLVWT